MSTVLFSAGAVALLFVVAGVLRARVGCSGQCGSCGASSCNLKQPKDRHG